MFLHWVTLIVCAAVAIFFTLMAHTDDEIYWRLKWNGWGDFGRYMLVTVPPVLGALSAAVALIG